MYTNRKPHQFYLQNISRMPPRLPTLGRGPGSCGRLLSCLPPLPLIVFTPRSRQRDPFEKLSQIMCFLCSNLPIFHSEEEPKSLQATRDFAPRFPDILSHFFTSLPLLQPRWPPCYFSGMSGAVLLRGLCTGCASCLDLPSRSSLHGASHPSSLQANVIFPMRPTLFSPESDPLPSFSVALTTRLIYLCIILLLCPPHPTQMSTPLGPGVSVSLITASSCLAQSVRHRTGSINVCRVSELERGTSLCRKTLGNSYYLLRIFL